MPQRTRERRRDELISLQQRIGEEWAQGRVGAEVDVLVEGCGGSGGQSLAMRRAWRVEGYSEL